MKTLLPILLCVLALHPAFCDNNPAPAAAILVKDGDKVAFLGDSITANGWSDPRGYVQLIVDALAQEGIKITPIPAGVSGNTSKDMLARLQADVLDKKPDWMTLSCGVNDVWHGDRGVDLDTYKQNITAIVDRALAAGIRVIILTSTPISEEDNTANRKLSAYNDFLRQLAKERKLPLADLSAGFHAALGDVPRTNASRDLTLDGVHMNPAGNLLMAKGCLLAMGFTDVQLSKAAAAWLAQPGTSFAPVQQADFGPGLIITLGQYMALQKLARDNKTDVLHMGTTLWFRALAAVIQAHEKDAVLDANAIRKESSARLMEKIAELGKE
jgi:lysophospholipase L1-like esterase